MRHEYIKGTKRPKKDLFKIKLQIIAIRLSCGYPLSRQQMYDWNNATVEEQYEAYGSIDTSEKLNNEKSYERDEIQVTE